MRFSRRISAHVLRLQLQLLEDIRGRSDIIPRGNHLCGVQPRIYRHATADES